MAAKRFDKTLGDKIVKAYKAGTSGPALSKQFKVTVSTVYYYLRLSKVKRRPRSVPGRIVAKGKARKPMVKKSKKVLKKAA